MNYRMLGETGLSVSVIGVGTWQFGGEWGRDYTQNEVDAILDRAAENGITLIDTAECYGDHLSERLIGDYLRRHGRRPWVIATKFGHRYQKFMTRSSDFSPEGVRGQLAASLEALGTDRVDLYQFHSGSDDAFLNDELWAMLHEERAAGRVGHLGISISSRGSRVQVEGASAAGAEVLQVVYNRLDRGPETEVFPRARADGLGLIARVPLASGMLAGGYRPGHHFTGHDVRATFDPVEVERKLREARRVRTEEMPAGCDPAAWALAWCLRDPVVSCAIPGCKTPEQVDRNARAAETVAG
jgi:aryl-alcohol dehydrogenase-like predicted oxidoreductase